MTKKFKLLEFGKINKNKTVINGFSPMTLEIHLGEWSPIADSYNVGGSIPLTTGACYTEPYRDGTRVPMDDRLIGYLNPQKKWLDKSNPNDVVMYLQGFCRCAPEFVVNEKPNGDKEYHLVGVSII